MSTDSDQKILPSARVPVALAMMLMTMAYAAVGQNNCQAPAAVTWPDNYLPRQGTVRIPVLLVRPKNATAPFPRAKYAAQFFGSWPTGSLRDYYLENSYGLLKLEGEVSDWLTLSEDDLFYEEICDFRPSGQCPDPPIKQLIEEAVAASGFDWTRYDNDNDGFVDVLAIVHAESSRQCGNGSSNLETNEFKYYNLTPETSRSYLDTGAVLPNGDPICVNEYLVVAGHNCEENDLNGIGGMAHELGHSLGLPDLEDQDGSDGGIGIWGLMGLGGSGADVESQERPTHLSAWAKQELGWVQPTKLTLEGVQDLAPIESKPAMYRFDGAWTGVYYLLENRQRVGFDRDIPATGLLVWRVDDATLTDWRKLNRTNSVFDSVNDNEDNRAVQLIEADGLAQIRRHLSVGDGGDPFPGSSNQHEFDLDSQPRNFSRNSLCEIYQTGREIRFRFVPQDFCGP